MFTVVTPHALLGALTHRNDKVMLDSPVEMTREELNSHVPANHDKSWIGGIVPPALRASLHSLSAGVMIASLLG